MLIKIASMTFGNQNWMDFQLQFTKNSEFYSTSDLRDTKLWNDLLTWSFIYRLGEFENSKVCFENLFFGLIENNNNDTNNYCFLSVSDVIQLTLG